jgi:hypothetical protein
MSTEPVNGPRPGGKGGDIIFCPGRGAFPDDGRPPGTDGDFVFLLADGTEFMRLRHDGVVTVRGTEVKDERHVYYWFARWVLAATARPGQGTGGGKPARFIPHGEEVSDGKQAP